MLRLSVLFVFLLSGCVSPPDIPACRPLNAMKVVTEVPDIGRVVTERPNPKCMKAIGESECGYCVWTISDRTQYVGEASKHHLNKKPWSAVMREAVLVPATEYAKVKKFVIDSCKKSNECAENISRWRVKLDALDFN